MAPSRMHALPEEPNAARRAELDASWVWRAEDERLALAEQSLDRLTELESLIRAQRDLIDEATAEARDHAARVLHELQDRADAEMRQLNALRFPRSATSEVTSTTATASTRKSWFRWTARGGGQLTFILGLYGAADIAPRASPAQRRRRRQLPRR